MMLETQNSSILDRLEKFVRHKGSVIKFLEIPAELFDDVKVSKERFSQSNYYRLAIGKFIKNGQVLYLDSDTLVLNNLEKLFQKNLGDNVVAAVPDPIDSSGSYFNSGVLLINTHQWNSLDVFEKTMELAVNTNNQWVDQDCLNSVLRKRWLVLENEYNLQTLHLEGINNHLTDHQQPFIIHFTGSLKPWNFRSNSPYKKYYWQFLRQSVARYMVPNNYSVIEKLKWYYLRFFYRS